MRWVANAHLRPVAAREEQRLVSAVTSGNDVRRMAVVPPHVVHFAITVRLSDAMSPDHDAITHARAHGFLLLGSDDIVVPSARRRVGPKVTTGVASPRADGPWGNVSCRSARRATRHRGTEDVALATLAHARRHRASRSKKDHPHPRLADTSRRAYQRITLVI